MRLRNTYVEKYKVNYKSKPKSHRKIKTYATSKTVRLEYTYHCLLCKLTKCTTAKRPHRTSPRYSHKSSQGSSLVKNTV